MNRRTGNWVEWLHLYLAAKATAPFIWGKNDCCLFVAEWITLATGVDMGAPFRDTYNSKEGAAQLLDTFGGFESFVTLQLQNAGIAEVPLAFAQRGDAIIARPHGIPSVGIVVDNTAAFMQEPCGLVFIPVHLCHRAWRVG